VYTTYSENGKIITLQEFQSFLIQEQRDPMSNDEREVSCFMRDYLQDSQRNVQEPFFTTIEVWMCCYLSNMHRSTFIELRTQEKYKRLKAGDKWE
jgi:hypothetical protein